MNSQITSHLIEAGFLLLSARIDAVFFYINGLPHLSPDFIQERKSDYISRFSHIKQDLFKYELKFGTDAMLNIYPEFDQHLSSFGITSEELPNV